MAQLDLIRRAITQCRKVVSDTVLFGVAAELSSPTVLPMADDAKIQIDSSLLADVGLTRLDSVEAEVLLRHIYETLEIRVGLALAQRMSDKQLDEFEAYFEVQDDKGAFQWLESNFPDYQQLVRKEFDLLSIELRQIAPTILALSGGQP